MESTGRKTSVRAHSLAYVLFEVVVDEAYVDELDPSKLPGNWKTDPAPSKVQTIGGPCPRGCQDPSSLPLLDGFDLKLGQFIAAEGATDQGASMT